MGKKLFPYLIALAAIAVSASAAFYSVSGLMKLFAGASLAVGIMASALEVSKLVIASLLYQYWDALNKVLRAYLITAALILILITSAGIYGFLSAAYEQTANTERITDQQISALEQKKKLFEQSRDNIVKEKDNLTQLKTSLAKSTTTQYTDRQGNLVVRSNNSTYRQLESTNQVEEKLNIKLQVANDSIFALENKILQSRVSASASSELGPLKYLSQLTGYSMDRIINWLLIIIMFVFDPLAIALVVSANFAFSRRSVESMPPTEQPQEQKPEIQPETEQTVEEEIQPVTEPPVPEQQQKLDEAIARIQSDPNFSQWKKKQMIEEKIRELRVTPEGKRYW